MYGNGVIVTCNELHAYQLRYFDIFDIFKHKMIDTVYIIVIGASSLTENKNAHIFSIADMSPHEGIIV